MARTAYPAAAAPGGSTAVDTDGYGTVTIVGTTTAASSAITITVCDTVDGSYAAPAAGEVIDPIAGTAPTLSGLSSGTTVIASYIGPKRFIKAVGTTTNVIIVLGEPRHGY
jgi:hypothetical protein